MRLIAAFAISVVSLPVAIAAQDRRELPPHKTEPPAAAAPLQPPSQSSGEEHNKPPANIQQYAQPDRRGTVDAPLIVEMNYPPKAQQQAAKNASEEKLKASTDRWTIRLTAALVIATALQFIALGIQAYWLRRTVKVAERAFAELERPLLHFVVDSTNWDGHSTWSAFFATEMPGHPVIPSINYSIKNYGRTPAVITNILIGADYGRDAPPINVATEIHLPKDHVIPVNGTTDALQVEPTRNIPNDITEGRHDRQVIRFW